MSFVALREAGATDLLLDAASTIEERGLAKGVVQNFKTGEVDVVGALFIAAGAKPKNVKTDSIEECRVPMIKHGILFGCMESLEAIYGDLAAWSDKSTQEEVCRALRDLADRFLIAVY